MMIVVMVSQEGQQLQDAVKLSERGENLQAFGSE